MATGQTGDLKPHGFWKAMGKSCPTVASTCFELADFQLADNAGVFIMADKAQKVGFFWAVHSEAQ